MVVTPFADKVLHFSHKEPNSTKVSHTYPIGEREHNGLQYLAVYAVFKLLKKKLKNNFADQKLIHSLNHGGLHAVMPECQELFRRTKWHFRIETNVTSIHRINIE